MLGILTGLETIVGITATMPEEIDVTRTSSMKRKVKYKSCVTISRLLRVGVPTRTASFRNNAGTMS